MNETRNIASPFIIYLPKSLYQRVFELVKDDPKMLADLERCYRIIQPLPKSDTPSRIAVFK